MQDKFDALPSRKERMEAALTAAFEPLHLSVRDDSEQHRGHGGWREEGETHFDVTMTSALFEGMNRVNRQRLVNKALAPELERGLHALAMHLSAPSETG